MPTPKGMARLSRSAPLSGPAESSGLRRLLRPAPAPVPLERLTTLGVGDGASVGGMMGCWMLLEGVTSLDESNKWRSSRSRDDRRGSKSRLVNVAT